MKKSTKIITTLMAIGASATVIAPITSCSCANECIITFKATKGGILKGSTSLKVKSGITWGQIPKSDKPEVIVQTGYKFQGWFAGKTLVTDSYEITADVTITATFEPTAPGYNITKLASDEGGRLEVIQNIFGQDIILGYEIEDPKLDFDNVVIYPGTIVIKKHDSVNKTVTIKPSSEWTLQTEIEFHLNLIAKGYDVQVTSDQEGELFVDSCLFGSDIILFYEIVNPNYGFENVEVTVDGKSYMTITEEDQGEVTIPYSTDWDANTKIVAHLNLKVIKYDVTVTDDEGCSSSIVSQTIGRDVVISYELYAGCSIKQIAATADGSIIDFTHDPLTHKITIDYQDIPTDLSVIVVDITTNQPELSLKIEQSDKIKFVQYYGQTTDKVATYHFVPQEGSLDIGDTVTAEIVKQEHVVTPGEDPKEVKEIGFYENVKTFEVTNPAAPITFNFESTYDGSDTDLFEVMFTLKLTIQRGPKLTFESTIEDIYFENGIATTSDMFSYDEEDTTKIIGVNTDDERWNNPDYNVLVVPKEATSIDFDDDQAAHLSNIEWLLLDETWGGILDPEGCKLSIIETATFQSMRGFHGQLYIPSSVTQILGGAFNKASGFAGCDLVFGTNSKLETIRGSAFNSTGLGGESGKLVLPSGLKFLGESAFYGCDFKSVTFPASLTDFEKSWPSGTHYGCFYNNSNLTEIDVSEFDTVPETWGNDGTGSKIGAGTFTGTAEKGVVWIKSAELAEAWEALLEKIGLSSSWEYKVHEE